MYSPRESSVVLKAVKNSDSAARFQEFPSASIRLPRVGVRPLSSSLALASPASGPGFLWPGEQAPWPVRQDQVRRPSSRSLALSRSVVPAGVRSWIRRASVRFPASGWHWDPWVAFPVPWVGLPPADLRQVGLRRADLPPAPFE